MTRTLDYASETVDRLKRELIVSRKLYQLCYSLINALNEFRDTKEFETILENIVLESEEAAQLN